MLDFLSDIDFKISWCCFPMPVHQLPRLGGRRNESRFGAGAEMEFMDLRFPLSKCLGDCSDRRAPLPLPFSQVLPPSLSGIPPKLTDIQLYQILEIC